MTNSVNQENSSGLALSLRFLKQKWSGSNKHEAKSEANPEIRSKTSKTKTFKSKMVAISPSNKENTNPVVITRSVSNEKTVQEKGIEQEPNRPRIKQKRSFFSLRSVGKPEYKEAAELAKFVAKTEQIDDEQKTEITESSTSAASETKVVSPIRRMISWFVGDLHKAVTEAMLRDYFIRYPGLLSVKIPKDIATGDSLGYGYVNYDTQEHADDAREALNYSDFFGSEIRIIPSLRDKTNRERIGANVFLSNLPSNGLTTRILYDKFKQYGNILSCKYIPQKNQCFIHFENKQDAQYMIERMSHTEIGESRVYAGLHILKKDRVEGKQRTPIPTALTATTEGVTTTTLKQISSVEDVKSSIISASASTPPPSTEYSIFIKNLPLTVEDNVIRSLMEPYGQVMSVLSRKVPNRGGTWALVTLPDLESVNRAIAGLNSFEIEGRKLFVTRAIPREQKDYAKKEERYPKKKLKILVTGLNIAANKAQFNILCRSFTSIKSVELYGTKAPASDGERSGSSRFSDYGYVEMVNETEADQFIEKLRLSGCECYKVCIEVSNRESNYETPHYRYLLPSASTNTESSSGISADIRSPVSVSYLDPTKLYRLAEFNKAVESDRHMLNRRRNFTDIRRKTDEIIWELAVRMFSEPLAGKNGSKSGGRRNKIAEGNGSIAKSELTEVKVHSLTEHMIKFFWVNRFDEFWRFLEMNQLDGRGRLLLPPHPLLRYQLIQSAAYLGIISNRI
ncbi:hypothetical protein FOA43_001439 [Brettanomyces nanus]|uniref:RRM domain-containing protein n=1 Tax=Eeniella nana TaxID=13502 RepID=A0A875RU23_EENNA|nr:uncharacterized protein FOA43_001439 [Brettanomyces nanus]QPG74117.1 hypothetical protein FOA43_001439 [Brettanomyces nanus]